MRVGIFLRGAFVGQGLGLLVVSPPCVVALLLLAFGVVTPSDCLGIAGALGLVGWIGGALLGAIELAPAYAEQEEIKEQEMQKLLKESGL